MSMSIYIAHHRKNNASNALDVPSIVQSGTSAVCDESSQFACSAHANCHEHVPCRWSSDSEATESDSGSVLSRHRRFGGK